MKKFLILLISIQLIFCQLNRNKQTNIQRTGNKQPFEYKQGLSYHLAYFARSCYSEKKMKELLNQTNKHNLNKYYLEDNSFGFIGYSKGLDAIIVAFRGTKGLKNMISDANIKKIKYDWCEKCEVHKGFYKHFNSIKGQLIYKITQISKKYPNKKVYVTGHSLGATMASFSIPEIQKIRNKPVDILITFGSPRIGNQDYAKWFDTSKIVEEYARVTNGNDLVVTLPYFGYYHYGHEVRYEDFSKQQSKYKLCKEGEDQECARAFYQKSKSDHSKYKDPQWNEVEDTCL